MQDYPFRIWATQYNSSDVGTNFVSETFEIFVGNSAYIMWYHHHTTIKAMYKQKHV